MSDMQLSIIIVNWNTRDLLAECLASIYASSHDLEVETIVVDNSSTDGSVEMVGARFPNVKLVVNKENRGFAGANNQAIALSQARYVLLLNSDAILPPSGLNKLVAFLDQNPRVGAVGPMYVNTDGSFQASYADFPRLWTELSQFLGLSRLLLGRYFPSHSLAESGELRSVDWIPGTALLVRSTAIGQVGYLDEGYFLYSEEVDWCYRMREQGWEVWYYPEVVVTHKLSQSANKVRENSLWHLYRGKIRFFAKHQGYVHATLLKICAVVALWLKAAIECILSLAGSRHRKRSKAYMNIALKIARERTRIAKDSLTV